MSEAILVEAFQRIDETTRRIEFDRIRKALTRFEEEKEAVEIEPEIADALKAICKRLERVQGLGVDLSPFVKRVMTQIDLMPAAV